MKNKIKYDHCKCSQTLLGPLTIYESQGYIVAISWTEHNVINHSSQLIDEAFRQIESYFNGQRKTFCIPFKITTGTPFQHKVWQALQTIPYGKTISYSELAAQINYPKAIRAVGMANHNNPLPIIIPCHRVIGKNGTLTGYAGGLPVKEKLLTLERHFYHLDTPFDV